MLNGELFTVTYFFDSLHPVGFSNKHGPGLCFPPASNSSILVEGTYSHLTYKSVCNHRRFSTDPYGLMNGTVGAAQSENNRLNHCSSSSTLLHSVYGTGWGQEKHGGLHEFCVPTLH